MGDIRKETETRYHIRFNNPYDHTVEVSKDVMMACQRAKDLLKMEFLLEELFML